MDNFLRIILIVLRERNIIPYIYMHRVKIETYRRCFRLFVRGPGRREGKKG